MSQRQKFLQSLLESSSTPAIDFSALCQLLVSLGFEQRIRGSHHLFGKPGIPALINLQLGPGNTVKLYQVKQVRNILLQYQAVFGLCCIGAKKTRLIWLKYLICPVAWLMARLKRKH